MENFDGKVAIVTGAAQGIGKVIVQKLAEAGAAVVFCDLLDAEGEQVAEEIRAKGGRAIYQQADVSSPQAVENLIQRAVESYGRLDILVNNAKADALGRITELELEDWNRVLAVCLTGSFLCAKYAIPPMIASGGGVILNISSVHALVAYTGFPAYDTAKAGLLGLTRQIAADYGPQGIRANTILPGRIVHEDFKQRRARLAPGLPTQEPYAAYYPAGRLGTSEDVAGAVLYLASDAAQFITGTELVVDGGLTARTQEWRLDTRDRRRWDRWRESRKDEG
jgi:NAD(P)-dependent dehydrogenase (short-subunit alcohol dehydrogenase family)